MKSLPRGLIALSAPLFFSALACTSGSGSPGGDGGAPDGAPNQDALILDSGSADLDAAMDDNGFHPADSGPATDGGGTDGGMPLTPSIDPGVGITFAEGQMRIGQTFTGVKAQFGTPVRRTPGMNARSYEYMLSGGATVTVWFSNTHLRQGDGTPPADVDAADQVLWIAVGGTFGGHTNDGLGLGSSQGTVQTTYGNAPHPVALSNPAGMLDAYYTQGILFAYDMGSLARTITVCAKYKHEPNGLIDPSQSQLTFTDGTIHGGLGGTSRNDVETLFGMPDASGTINITINIDVAAYAFIGLEVYYVGGNALFMSVHAPYYGPTAMAGMPSMSSHLGDTRSAFEAYLAAAGFGGPLTSQIMGVVCYKTGGAAPTVGATYSADMPPVVTSIVVAHPASACH